MTDKSKAARSDSDGFFNLEIEKMKPRHFLYAALFAGTALFISIVLTGCSTPQEKKGVNPKPFNTPASWESEGYGKKSFN
jgi:hypothetical protein